MLVLTRKSGETITIGNDIRITIIGIKGKQVRLGIEAPSETTIHREEIYDRIQTENRLAAVRTSVDLDKITDLWRNNRKETRGKVIDTGRDTLWRHRG